MSKRRGPRKTSRKVHSADPFQDCCCFICDGPVKGNGVQIILARTPYSNVGLPAKIGELIGDNFMVVIGTSDTLCARCASLIRQLDKLENDARAVKKTLTGYIAAKYQLNQREIYTKSDREVECESREPFSGTFSCDQVHGENKRKTLQIEELTKQVLLGCDNCNFSTTDKDALQIHVALCLRQVKSCMQCGESFNRQETLYTYVGTCNICSQSYDLEEEFSKHIMEHTDNLNKCGVCNFFSDQRSEMLDHLGAHGVQVFNCTVCHSSFNLKTTLKEHLESHTIYEKCQICSEGSVSQTKILKEGGMNAPCLTEDDLCHMTRIDPNGRAINECMESLMSFETDGSNIEFHTCPNCEVTFVNKMLFNEHMKMHDENQDHVNVSAAHEEVLKSASESVTGDCPIDDDLEDLFEKLHAETTSSSHQIHVVKSDNHSSQDLHFTESLENEDLTFCSSWTTGADELTSSCGSQDDMVVQGATFNTDSGRIHLLPYVAMKNQQQSAVSESNMDGCDKLLTEGQDFHKKPVPGLAENNLVVMSPAGFSTFSCDFCSFQTSIEVVIKRHLKIHQGNKVRNCSICNRVFSSTQRLLSHLNIRHKDVTSITCPLCSENFEKSELLGDHLSEKHPVEKDNFPCRFCSKKFFTQKSCTSHEETHSEVFSFQCEICLQKFTSSDDLNDHITYDHQQAGQCRYCGKKIDKPKALKHHEQRHEQESNHHECPECKRVFKTKTGLRHHSATHTGQFKFYCDFCSRGFMSRMMLEEHRSCHTKEERYICEICGQKFQFQSTYWIHKKWHENPYPYKCNFCGRFFKHSSLLAVHKRKHTGERPYICPHCPLTFPVSGTLKRHMILHTGVYPFNCNACKRGFTARHKYAAHMEKCHGTQNAFLNDVKEDACNLADSRSELDVSKSWKQEDVNLAQNVQVFSIPDTSFNKKGDTLENNQNNHSRVVEIVLDDSFQPVATVTLGGSESMIPDHWYV